VKGTQQPTSQDYSSLIGIPYETKNCWDIAVELYEKVLGVNLKNYYSGPTPDRSTTKNLIWSNIGEFEKVSTPMFGYIILIKLHGVESHIAIYVGIGKMLHTTRGAGSVIDRVERWKSAIVGFYRIKNDKN